MGNKLSPLISSNNRMNPNVSISVPQTEIERVSYDDPINPVIPYDNNNCLPIVGIWSNTTKCVIFYTVSLNRETNNYFLTQINTYPIQFQTMCALITDKKRNNDAHYTRRGNFAHRICQETDNLLDEIISKQSSSDYKIIPTLFCIEFRNKDIDDQALLSVRIITLYNSVDNSFDKHISKTKFYIGGNIRKIRCKDNIRKLWCSFLYANEKNSEYSPASNDLITLRKCYWGCKQTANSVVLKNAGPIDVFKNNNDVFKNNNDVSESSDPI